MNHNKKFNMNLFHTILGWLENILLLHQANIYSKIN